jgi:hypothetical protein
MVDVWARLWDRLASIDTRTSMIVVTSDYAAHFSYMYVKNHNVCIPPVSLLELLMTNLHQKSGEVNMWKLKKEHSILHRDKVRELILFSWSENFSTQGQEHCHIDLCKKVAACTNNKHVLLCIVLLGITLSKPSLSVPLGRTLR